MTHFDQSPHDYLQQRFNEEKEAQDRELLATPFRGNFPEFRVAPDEKLLVDLGARKRRLAFPVLETMLASGVLWAVVGMIDSHVGPFVEGDYHGLRTALLLAWLVAVVCFLGRPLIAWRHHRVAVTNYRVVVRFSKRDVFEVPLSEVTGVQRKRSTLVIHSGWAAPLVIPDVARPRKVARIIDRRVRHYA